MTYEFGEKAPQLSDDIFIADTAAVLGDVAVDRGSSIWFGAAVRGDEGHIKIGENSNIQDNATIHSGTDIGCGVTIGHNAIVHGCTIGNNSLIGMGAIVLDGAEIGENCIVGAGALVTMGKVFPNNSLIIGSPASVKRSLTDEEVASIKQNAKEYVSLSRKYR